MRIQPQTFPLPSGEILVIRSAEPPDARSQCRHRRLTSGETDFMARYPEECTFDPEQIGRELAATAESPRDFTVTAFLGERVVGDLAVTQVRDRLKLRHRANLGISIQRAFWGNGLGRRMLEIAIAQARANGFEQLELGVFADNPRAIHLYKSVGFRQYGVLPKAFKLKDGTYRDEVLMVRML